MTVRISRTSMNMNSESRWGRMIVGYLIGCLALFELERIINLPEIDPLFSWLTILELILTGYVLSVVFPRKHIWMDILVAGMLWILFTSLIRGVDILEEAKKYLSRGVLVYLLCPATALVIPRDGIKNFLRFFIGTWTLFYAALSALGIYCVMSGIRITDASGIRAIEIPVNSGRLSLFYYTTITAANLTTSLMMCLIGMFLYENRASRIWYGIKMIPMFICLGLTNGRSGYIATGIGFGVSLACILFPVIKKRVKSSWIRGFVCCLTVGVVAAGSVLLNYQTVRAYNAFSSRAVSETVSAEKTLSVETSGDSEMEAVKATEWETEKASPDGNVAQAAGRALINENTLSGRQVIWKAALDAIRNHPVVLITGTSVSRAKEYYNQYLSRPGAFYHLHNILLQILLETGLVGLTLAVSFLVLLFMASFRLGRNTGLPTWQRLCFLPVGLGVLMEMVECLMWLGWSTQHQVVVMLFAGIVLSLAENAKEEEKIAHKEINSTNNRN